LRFIYALISYFCYFNCVFLLVLFFLKCFIHAFISYFCYF
jgi:hypothetical protein